MDEVDKAAFGWADYLSQFRGSDWVQNLGGSFVAGFGVVITFAGSLIG
ncbi:MAG TPA: hypothetical protein VJ935_04530 [Acidimicrobiia bacterium]|nr:hypothetical protein [Acidimicrobiia bacterium]